MTAPLTSMDSLWTPGPLIQQTCDLSPLQALLSLVPSAPNSNYILLGGKYPLRQWSYLRFSCSEELLHCMHEAYCWRQHAAASCHITVAARQHRCAIQEAGRAEQLLRAIAIRGLGIEALSEVLSLTHTCTQRTTLLKEI